MFIKITKNNELEILNTDHIMEVKEEQDEKLFAADYPVCITLATGRTIYCDQKFEFFENILIGTKGISVS